MPLPHHYVTHGPHAVKTCNCEPFASELFLSEWSWAPVALEGRRLGLMTMRDSILLETYREHKGDLLRFLGRRLGSNVTASDVLSDLYVKLLGTSEEEAIKDRRAYLFTMAANLATDHLRTEMRRAELLQEADPAHWQRSDPTTPEQISMARGELRHMEGAIRTLPERCRRVFYLCRFEGRTQSEVAELMGIGVTSVYKDLKLAMSVLVQAKKNFRGEDSDTDGHGKD